MWLFGSILIFFLARLLGKEVTFNQTLGLIGYCLLPLLVVVFVLNLIGETSWVSSLLKIGGTVWSSFSAGSLLSLDTPSLKYYQKQIMLTYPILLLYIYFISLYGGA